MKLDIILKGQYYNHWPFVSVKINNQTMFDSTIQDIQTLSFIIDSQEHNQLTIEHKGKCFGENGIWDSSPTEHSSSCSVQICDILFDDVSVGSGMINELVMVTKWSQTQLAQNNDLIEKYSKFLCHGVMNFNGTVTLEFPKLVYNWLIDKKYKIPLTDTAYFSDYSSRWHYSQDIELLEEIKTLVKYDKNRSNKCS